MRSNYSDMVARRLQSGEFLRSRRERLTPSDVGLPNGLRRRTPGLRREEVALLAGVGVTWYTWLEQGRDVQPSAEVLSALADVLRLNAAERRLGQNRKADDEGHVARKEERVTRGRARAPRDRSADSRA